MEEWIHKLTRATCYIGMVLLIPMMLLTSGDVFSRGLLDKPIPGTLELSSYMLAVFILLGLAYTQQVKGHVRVEMLISRLPQKLASVLGVVTDLLCLFMIAILIWQGWILGVGEKAVSDMLRIPQWPFKLLVCVAAVLIFLEFLTDLVSSTKKLIGS